MFRYNSDKIHIVICEAKYSKFIINFIFAEKLRNVMVISLTPWLFLRKIMYGNMIPQMSI